jgi:hypothetical protein
MTSQFGWADALQNAAPPFAERTFRCSPAHFPVFSWLRRRPPLISYSSELKSRLLYFKRIGPSEGAC